MGLLVPRKWPGHQKKSAKCVLTSQAGRWVKVARLVVRRNCSPEIAGDEVEREHLSSNLASEASLMCDPRQVLSPPPTISFLFCKVGMIMAPTHPGLLLGSFEIT